MMNTGDSGTNKTTIFLEYMNEIYVDRDFYSRGKIIEMAKDKYVELHGDVIKDTIVSKIKEWFDFNLKDSGPFGFRYIGEGSPCVVSDRLLYFENHQYLTLDQWAELFLPKEEFSNGQIVHEDGRIMIMKGDGRKFHVLYDSRKEDFPLTKGFCIDSEYGEEDSCLDFRPATKEEKQTLFNRLEEVGKKWNPKTLQIEDSIDFSILNDEDWFYVESTSDLKWVGKGNIIDKNSTSTHFCLSTNALYRNHNQLVDKDEIVILRKATPEDLAPMFEKHPELAPPKEGDWGVFWNVEYKTPDKIMRLEKIERVHPFNNCVKQFFSADGLIYDNFAKVNLNNPLLPQLDELKKKIK